MKKAFTLVEVMIIVVIIGLLSAIAIPAYQKVKFESIKKELVANHDITSEQRQWFYEHSDGHGNWKGSSSTSKTKDEVQVDRIVEATKDAVSQIAGGGDFQRLVVDGKTYILVPKQEARETEIAGKTYWLIPKSP